MRFFRSLLFLFYLLCFFFLLLLHNNFWSFLSLSLIHLSRRLLCPLSSSELSALNGSSSSDCERETRSWKKWKNVFSERVIWSRKDFVVATTSSMSTFYVFAFLIISSSTWRTKEMSLNFAYFYASLSDCRRKEKKLYGMKRAKSCCSQQSIFQLDDSRVSFSLFIDDEKVLRVNHRITKLFLIVSRLSCAHSTPMTFTPSQSIAASMLSSLLQFNEIIE